MQDAGLELVLLNSAQKAKLRDVLDMVISGGYGIAVARSGAHWTVSRIGAGGGNGNGSDTGVFWAKLLKWQEHTNNCRYKYEWKEVAWLKGNNDDIFDLPNGRHGEISADPATYAINVIEQNNVARPGKQGNSVKETRTGFPPGFFLQPAGGGKTAATQEGIHDCANLVVVAMHTVALWESDGHGGYKQSGAIGYQFAYENAHDGDC